MVAVAHWLWLTILTWVVVGLSSVADANFKLPSGVLQGDFKWLGSYGECVNVNVTVPIKTHYCTATIGGTQVSGHRKLLIRSVVICCLISLVHYNLGQPLQDVDFCPTGTHV